jgi:hypothetical protein
MRFGTILTTFVNRRAGEFRLCAVRPGTGVGDEDGNLQSGNQVISSQL